MIRQILVLIVFALAQPLSAHKSVAQSHPSSLPVLEIEYLEDLSLMRVFSEMHAHFGADRTTAEWSVLVTKEARSQAKPLLKLFRHDPEPEHLWWLSIKLCVLEVCVQQDVCPAGLPVWQAGESEMEEVAFYRPTDADLRSLMRGGFMFEVVAENGVLFLFEGLDSVALSPAEQLFVSWAKN